MENKSTHQMLLESDALQRMIRDRSGKGSAVIKFKGLTDLESKTTLISDTVGRTTSGVIPIQRIPQQIIEPARETLTIRDMLTVLPTTAGVVDFVKVTTDPVAATSVNDASPKAAQTAVLASASAKVTTISAYIPASRQILDDLVGLAAFLERSLAYAVRKEEDRQIYLGTGSDQDMNGLINQAAAFDTSLFIAADGYQYIDNFGRACQQVDLADEIASQFIVVHPDLYWYLRLFHSGVTGEYIYRELFGEWDLTLLRSTVLSSWQFLVGSRSPLAAQIHDRQELIVEISLNDNDNFRRNLVTIRGEERVALTVQHPNAFVTGTVSKSPA